MTAYENLKNELEYLKTVREKEVADQIKEARSFGDLSENSEYDEAKNEQGKLFSRKAELENILLRLQKARSEQEKAAVFEDDYLYCGEDVKEFRQLYLRYNKRGRYYAMLKRTEMFLKPENIWKKAKQMISFLQKRNLYRGRAR